MHGSPFWSRELPKSWPHLWPPLTSSLTSAPSTPLLTSSPCSPAFPPFLHAVPITLFPAIFPGAKFICFVGKFQILSFKSTIQKIGARKNKRFSVIGLYEKLLKYVKWYQETCCHGSTLDLLFAIQGTLWWSSNYVSTSSSPESTQSSTLSYVKKKSTINCT